MASVRITGDLQRSVEHKINTKFFQQSELIKNTLSKTFGDRVYAHALRKELKAMMSLPDTFFAQSKTVTALLQHFELPDIKADLLLTESKPIPHGVHVSYSKYLECTNGQLYAEYKTMHDKLRALNREQDSVRHAIVNGLVQFTTLKKFLAVMPEAEMFIPQGALNTHYANAPKKPVVQKELHTPEGLTQEQRVTLARAKMMGG